MKPPMNHGIRERREAAHLSQLELAVRSDCSPGFIQQLEGGYIPKQSKVLVRVLAALDDAEKAAA